IPLRTSAATIDSESQTPAGAALVAERFEGDAPDEAYRRRVTTVCRHAERALQNSLEHEDIPFFRLLHTLQRARWFVDARRLPKTLSIAAAGLATALALVLVPTDFEIEGRGVLQPKN